MITNNTTYYIYMLECSNGHIYTGQTTNFDKRWQQHLQGHSSCKYTRSFPPKRVLLCMQFSCNLSDILKLEYAIKRLPKIKKLALIADNEQIQPLIKHLGLSIKLV